MEQGRVKWVKTTEYTYEGELPVTVVETMEEFPEEQEAVTESGILATAEDYVEIKSPEEPGVIPERYPGWRVFKATKGYVQLYKPRQEGGDTPKGGEAGSSAQTPRVILSSNALTPGSEVSDPKEDI